VRTATLPLITIVHLGSSGLVSQFPPSSPDVFASSEHLIQIKAPENEKLPYL
jgi:hypothetical protein